LGFCLNRFPRHARGARRIVRLLRADVGPEADVESAALAFGELVANAMRHAPPGQVRVELRWRDAKATLSVTDCGAGFAFDPSLPDVGQVGGRGLYIVNHLTGPVRIEHRADGGCSVSVELRLTALR